MLLNAEFPAGLWAKKHHSSNKQKPLENTFNVLWLELQLQMTSKKCISCIDFFQCSSLSTENPKTGTAAGASWSPCADSPENGYVIWNLYQTGPQKEQEGQSKPIKTHAKTQLNSLRASDSSDWSDLILLALGFSWAQFEWPSVQFQDCHILSHTVTESSLLVKEGREVSGFCLWTFSLPDRTNQQLFSPVDAKNPWPLASLAQVVPKSCQNWVLEVHLDLLRL